MRIATYNADLSRRGPGLLLRDILGGKDPQVAAVIEVIATAHPDILLLTGFDWDLHNVALKAFADALKVNGMDLPHLFSKRPNTGRPTGLDIDGNGRLGEARDAQGYGRFTGEGGMAILSRFPVGPDARDFTEMLWLDLPGNIAPPETPDIQRLSTTGHWDVPVTLPDGTDLHVLAWLATPPIFDGPEDRNGRRNHDESAFWLHLLDGVVGAPPPAPFVLLGDANLDPVHGDGRPEAIRALLADPRLQDPAPKGFGSPDTATADFGGSSGADALRVDYILPSRDLTVTAAGVLWPDAGDDFLPTVEAASRHRLVWVDIALP